MLQTTPRAEQLAILKAIQCGESPQRIISDHENHVNDLVAYARGSRKMLNKKNPNLDIWWMVHEAIQRRGGMCESGQNMLWVQWQRAHLRASTSETAEQKFFRRGNNAADHYANEGRRLHKDVANQRSRTDFLAEVAVAWARWTGQLCVFPRS